MTVRLPLLAAVAAAVSAHAADAQTWRTITSARQRQGEQNVRVEVRYAVGRFSLAPGSSGQLYRMNLRYDEETFSPVREYNALTGLLRLGVRGREGSRAHWRDRRGDGPTPALDLALAPDVPLALDIELGAAASDVQLGGLALRSVHYRTGASETRLDFARPNPVSCEALVIEAGAAQVRVSGLGNSNCTRLEVHGGVGELHLDFTGRWRQGMTADVNVGIGALRLRLPSDVGVSLKLTRFLASFEAPGFVRRADTWYSENWATARQRLALRVNASLGGVDVAWVNSN
jgi:hypothetical protein